MRCFGRRTEIVEPPRRGRGGNRDGADEPNDSYHRERYNVVLLASRVGWLAQGWSRSRGRRSRARGPVRIRYRGQISILNNAVSSNPAAVVIAPTQYVALGKPIDEAAKKLKIIAIDSAVDSKALTSFLTTDNEQAGRIAADILAERIQKTYADAEGDVALITSLPGVASLDQRAKGFKEQLAAKYGALSIVAEKFADGQASTGRKIMTEIIAASPELRGVFASNLIMAQGAAQAVAESKTNKTGDKINLIGFDSDDQLVKFLQDGTIAALVVQDPFRMGYDSVETALAASKGEQVPATVDIGANVVTKANINSARSQELLNPKIK